MPRFTAFLTSCALLLLVSASPLVGQRQPSLPAVNTAPTESLTLSGLPVDFVENRGQWDSEALFVARQGRMAAALEPGAIRLLLSAEHPAEVVLSFDGVSKDATLTGEQQRSGHYNFFLGNDARKWRSNVPTFGAVRYRGVYEGVDLRVLQRDGRLEYDLLLAPGANLDPVVIRSEGTSGMQIEADGSLVLETAAGPLRQSAPITWEELPDGTTRRLESRFRKIDAQRYGFEVPGRDSNLPLVIDPGLEWSTFLGGSNREEVRDLALAQDGSGDVVIAGTTFSNDFPNAATAPPGYLGASPLIPFVARLNSSGTSLVYATVFGSTNGNVAYGLGLTLDASSAPIVVGETNGADFPTTPGAYQPRFNEPSATINRGWDGFVTRFNAAGNQMVFSTYLGAPPIFDPNFVGSKKGGDESARVVVMDAADNVIVAGYTTSDGFPTTAGAYDRTKESLIVPVSDPEGTIHSHTDAFIARLNPTGTQLTYSTFLGGQSDDIIRDMVIDAQGVLTLVGTEAPLETTDGQNRTQHGVPFPTTADAIDRTHKGASDIFVTRLRLDGAGANDLKYSTILGAFYIEETTSVALDPNNPELVTISGYTRSWDFPTTAGAWRRAALFNVEGNPYYSGFLLRFRFPATGGGSLVWSTLITGESTGQYAESVVVDPSGDVILVGNDIAGTYPTTDRSYRRLPLKGSFVSRFSGDGKNLLYSTILGKSSGALVFTMQGVSTGPRSVVVAGSTLFPDHPTTPGAYDRVFGSNGTSDGFHTYDGFVSKLSLEPNATADTTADAPALVSPANGATFPLNSPLTLDWTDVTDPSGVQFYQVQIAGNADFLNGFTFFNLAQGFWTVSQAAGSTGEEGIQYWRVRTLDGVNNFSPWSEVRRFTVGAPTWTNFAATSLTPNGVVGGSTVLGKVHILNVAPPGGQVYTLTSDNPSVASVPPSVTIPAGQSSATYVVTTHNVPVSTPVLLTVWSEGNGDHPILWVDPAPPGIVSLSSLALSPTTVTGGASSQGTVTLSGPAPSGGAVVTLSSSNGAAGVPDAVTVAAGASSATFTVTTTAVTTSTVATVTGTLDGTSRTANLTITPSGGGGGGAPGFNSPTANAADSGGDGNGFQSNPSTAHADDTSSASDTNSGSGTSTSCTSTAKDRHRFFNYGFSIPTGVSITGVEVRLDARADSTAGTPRMCVQLSWDGGTTWTTAKSTATLGTSMTTFTLGGSADAWGRTWSAANFADASFRLRVINVSSSTSRDFFLDWIAVRPHYTTGAPAGLSAVSVSPTTITGGSPSTGTVTLTAAAPAGGVVVSLASSNTSVVTVPASVTVAAGATSATFAATTAAVTANTSVTITANYSGTSRTTTLTATPPPPPASLSAVSVNPTSVVGGTSSQGTVTLTSAAPTGGLAVTLTSSHPAATVPGSVTVAAGATTATFTATTTTVGASTPVTITATNAGVTRTAVLTVTPPATTVTLTVTATGRSGERITSSPTGINVSVGSTASASFAAGTSITLSVSNGRDAIWSGACSSGGNKTKTCTFTLNATASVTGNVQ